MQKEHLQRLVYRSCSGEYVELLQLKPNDSGKSGVWDKFRLVIYDGKAQEYCRDGDIIWAMKVHNFSSPHLRSDQWTNFKRRT